MTREPIARPTSGHVRGIAADGLTTFCAIPYAAPPLGELRFAAPAPLAPWHGIRDCTTPGASAPQGPSRLDAVMGILPFEQSEDCLTLSVWTPAADGKKRPVIYWLHGGAYQSGGAHQGFYDGSSLAHACDVVVVGVNYRLGALGYLYLPEAEPAGVASANRGLLDQMQALRWVSDNIAAFGGDPARITICGQSAGGGSVLALLADPASRALVAHAIPMSASTGSLSIERASEISARFCQLAGISRDDIVKLRALPVDAIVKAQRAVQMEIAAKGDRTIAWQNVVGGPGCPLNPASAIIKGAARDIPILIGSTLDEGHAWLAQDDKLVAETDASVIALTAEAGGYAKAAEDLPRERAVAGKKPWEVLSAMMTWAVFEKPSRKVAAGHSINGGTAYVYRFEWRPTLDARFGACHCIELPFAFDNLDRWPPDSAMMAGHDPESYRALAARIRDAWGAFAHAGNPATAAVPDWPRWTPGTRPCMVLDDDCRIVRE
jgi:para-nitrobenzyl esterase